MKKAQFKIGAIVEYYDKENGGACRYLLIKRVRKARPDSEPNNKQWVYDGIVLKVTDEGKIECRTGVLCILEGSITPVTGLG